MSTFELCPYLCIERVVRCILESFFAFVLDKSASLSLKLPLTNTPYIFHFTKLIKL